MPVIRIPFVGSLTTRGGQKATDFTTYDQLFQNVVWDVVQNPVTGKSVVYVDRRPGFWGGLGPISNMSALHLTYQWSNLGSDQVVYGGIQSAGSNARVYGSGTIYTHASADEVNYFSETYNSASTASLVWQRTNGEAWIYPNGGAVAQISAIPSGNVGPIVHMDGYAFVAIAATATIRNSALNDPETWPTTGAIVAQEQPDRLVTLGRYKNFIVAFGTYSTEFFVNAGNAAGSPLQRVQGMMRRVGIYSRQTLAYGMDRMFLVSKGFDQPFSIIAMSADGIERLSTPIVESILMSVGNGISGLHFFQMNGAHYLAVAWRDNTPLSHALVYNFETKLWCYWKSAVSGMRWDRAIYQSPSAPYRISTFVDGSATVYIVETYSTNVKYYDDVTGSATGIERIVRTASVDDGTMLAKTEKSIAIIGDKESSTHNIAYSYSDDGYANFSTARNIDKSRTDNRIYRNGRYRSRSRRFVDSNQSRSRMEAYEYDVEIGST